MKCKSFYFDVGASLDCKSLVGQSQWQSQSRETRSGHARRLVSVSSASQELLLLPYLPLALPCWQCYKRLQVNFHIGT